MRNFGFLVVSLFAFSCKTTEAQASGAATTPPTTPATTAATTTPPTTTAPATPAPPKAGPANLAFTCTQPKAGCEPTSFSMTLLGDLAECSVTGPGALRLEIKSSNDDHDGIVIGLEGYHGPGGYLLDDPARKFLRLSDGVAWNGCKGSTTMGKTVTAGDRGCSSPQCLVEIFDENPDAPWPRPLTFAVRCESLCESGARATCQGPMSFTAKVDCS